MWFSWVTSVAQADTLESSSQFYIIAYEQLGKTNGCVCDGVGTNLMIELLL